MIDLDQLKADREAGTPGEWRSERDTCHFDTLSDIYAGKALIAQTGATPVQAQEADARRIARLPDLEAAYIEAVAKLDQAVEALVYYAKDHDVPDEGPWGIGSDDFGNTALAALALITAKPERDE